MSVDQVAVDNAWLRRLGRQVVDAFDDEHSRAHSSPLRRNDCKTCTQILSWRRQFAAPLEDDETAKRSCMSGELPITPSASPHALGAPPSTAPSWQRTTTPTIGFAVEATRGTATTSAAGHGIWFWRRGNVAEPVSSMEARPGVFNVLDYGADPTGEADSTTAIQAAIDAASTANDEAAS